MKVARWLLPIVSLAIVLFLTWRDVGGARTSPGPLHPVHAGLAALELGAQCDACHERGGGIAVDGCNRCHEKVGAQLASGVGLHGRLPAEARARCGSCHGDHHGDTVALIAPFAWERTGVAERTKYDHRDVEFTLVGAHVGLQCGKCHPRADDSIPPAGGRFLGLSQRCTSCHEDVHKAAYGSDCASCHGQERPWKEVPKFPHAKFALAGAHAQVACRKCHEPGTPHDVAALRQQEQPVRACAACHADPHGGGEQVTALRLPTAGDCARCHDATAWRAARRSPEQHAEYGFPLAGAHATTACKTCHGDATVAARWRGEAPALAACAACHESPHTGALVAAATAASGPAAGCADCHRDTDEDFAGGRITAVQHAATGFLLDAPHADLACLKCHEGAERARRFPGREAADCRACHRDVHRGQFDDERRYRQCTACHLPTTFRPSGFGVAAHAATAFPLTGAHDAVACVRCHTEVVDDARRFHGTGTACESCHADVHRGGFDVPGRPRQVEGRTGCVRCHDTQAFAPVVAGFDHALWTGYELVGAHRQVDCAKCHPRGAVGAATPARRLGEAPGKRCADCHADPHAGQFARAGATDCARCHDATNFREVHFDHRQSRFPLDEVHRVVACSKCHPAYDAGEGQRIVRYRPLGTSCGDCHKLGVPARGGVK
jgi:hypothetical protein